MKKEINFSKIVASLITATTIISSCPNVWAIEQRDTIKDEVLWSTSFQNDDLVNKVDEEKGSENVRGYVPTEKKFRKLHAFIQFHTSPQLHNIGVLRMKTLSHIAMVL